MSPETYTAAKTRAERYGRFCAAVDRCRVEARAILADKQSAPSLRKIAERFLEQWGA